MVVQSLLSFLALSIPGAFAQIGGYYGPAATHPKAGDLAPDITFTGTLSAPSSASWIQSNLSGQLTVLAFFPDTSHNLQSVTIWNAVVEKFAGKPVQFVWITGEKNSTLLPWLSQHSIKGWVFQDLKAQTGNAYGMELPANVIIGADRKIVGFYNGITQTEKLLDAVQDGRVTTTRPDKATIKAFIQSNLVFLDAEPPRMPRLDDHRPPFPPSYTVHVSLSQGEERGNFSTGDFWSLQGYTLKQAIGLLHNVNLIRIQLPPSLDNDKSYDIALVLPENEDQTKLKSRLDQGLQDYFHVIVRRENRLQDVYVVTNVPGHKPPTMKPQTGERMGGFIRSSRVIFEAAGGLGDVREMKPLSIDSIRGVSIDGTADEFCHTLEAELDRPVVNETNLTGEFRFHIESTENAKNDFREHLRDQLGMVITPAQRSVETVVLEPR